MKLSTIVLASSLLIYITLYSLVAVITSQGPFLHLDAGTHGIALASITAIISYGSYIVAVALFGNDIAVSTNF